MTRMPLPVNWAPLTPMRIDCGVERRISRDLLVRIDVVPDSGWAWNYRPGFMPELTEDGKTILQAAYVLHRIDCAMWALGHLSMPDPYQGQRKLDEMWARYTNAQRQEVITWAGARLRVGREQTRVWLEELGYPRWWGLHDDQASAGVGSAVHGGTEQQPSAQEKVTEQ